MCEQALARGPERILFYYSNLLERILNGFSSRYTTLYCCLFIKAVLIDTIIFINIALWSCMIVRATFPRGFLTIVLLFKYQLYGNQQLGVERWPIVIFKKLLNVKVWGLGLVEGIRGKSMNSYLSHRALQACIHYSRILGYALYWAGPSIENL